MTRGLAVVAPMTPGQLGRLQALWRAWTGRLALPAETDRKLRHYYVQLFPAGGRRGN